MEWCLDPNKDPNKAYKWIRDQIGSDEWKESRNRLDNCILLIWIIIKKYKGLNRGHNNMELTWLTTFVWSNR